MSYVKSCIYDNDAGIICIREIELNEGKQTVSK